MDTFLESTIKDDCYNLISMASGIIYVMTTTVTGLVKIGKSGTDNFQGRMRFLETNGYRNVGGLKRYFAIEVQDYDDKERLLHEILGRYQVGESELFAIEHDLLRQLLLSLEGSVVYPKIQNKEEEFDEIATVRKQSARFSFYQKGLKDGEKINFVADDSIKATVVSEREVEYDGQVWKLSPLTYKIFEDKGQSNNSGAYRGPSYWQYNGKRLTELSDVTG